MEKEGQINFKALMAKFQEEGLLAHSKNSRPAIAEKPKLLQPFLGHCSAVVSGIATAVENHTPEIPCVLFRDGLPSSGGKRPISFPPHSKQSSPSSQVADGDGCLKQSLKDRHMPLVLPVPPVKNHQAYGTETGKEAFRLTKIKKKGLLLPFKSAKASKNSNGEESAYGYLPSRPCSAPSEFSMMGNQSTERASLQSDQSTSEYPVSSPEFAASPPPPGTYPDSNNKVLSTLEKAKKKLCRRQIVTPTIPKGLPSPDCSCREKSFRLSPKNAERLASPPPTCLPHLACISARPFFKANNSARKPTFNRQPFMEKANQRPLRPAEPCSPRVPLKKLLPELWTLGPVPVKPPRPPTVDISSYQAALNEESSPNRCQTPNNDEIAILDAPDFSDFEISEFEAVLVEPFDIIALESASPDVVVGNPTTPSVSEAADYEAPDPALSLCEPAESNRSYVVRDLNLGSPNIIPLDPTSFPEPIHLCEFPELPLPEQRSYSEEAAVDAFLNSRPDETIAGALERPSFPEECDLIAPPTSNHEPQTRPNEHHQNSYYETFDNVYEDVEINKSLASQMSAKRKGGLKNPYADGKSKKGETCLHKRPPHPWCSTLSEQSHLAHHIIKQHASPNTADYKEQRKREKHRLERERKEQKEREKKENEMKKKFKVTGEEEPMYHAKVTVASKVRKNDLPVGNGDTVSIIRTTNCPRGKWLARDANHKYGYISVMNVELNIKDMLELGKKAQAAGRGAYVEPDTISIGSRSSNPNPLLTSSFSDDSEEWACEDEPLSPSYESHIAQQTVSEPEMSCVHVETQHTISDSNLEDPHTQTKHEALQKLAMLVQHSRADAADGGAASSLLCSVEEPPYPEQEIDFTELELLPPPPLYADTL